MSKSRTITIRVPAEYLKRLDELATSTNRTPSEIAGEALAAYLELQEWQIAAIAKAAEEADAGAKPIDHNAVASWLRSWGSETETHRPS